MKSRQRLNRRKDHRIFAKTAKKTNAMNVPGHIVARGGIRL